jgi:hypothetical protein
MIGSPPDAFGEGTKVSQRCDGNEEAAKSVIVNELRLRYMSVSFGVKRKK